MRRYRKAQNRHEAMCLYFKCPKGFLCHILIRFCYLGKLCLCCPSCKKVCLLYQNYVIVIVDPFFVCSAFPFNMHFLQV